MVLRAVRLGLGVLKGAGEALEDVGGSPYEADPGGVRSGLKVGNGDRGTLAVIVVPVTATAAETHPVSPRLPR
jgi:hypothetical protein